MQEGANVATALRATPLRLVASAIGSDQPSEPRARRSVRASDLDTATVDRLERLVRRRAHRQVLGQAHAAAEVGVAYMAAGGDYARLSPLMLMSELFNLHPVRSGFGPFARIALLDSPQVRGLGRLDELYDHVWRFAELFEALSGFARNFPVGL